MRKTEKQQIVKNVGSSWFSLGINVLVGLLLSPFILHRIGDTAFGIWVLIFSVTGYYGLFDLGIRSSIVRYVSKSTATGDREALAKLINTSLFTYSCIGVVSLLVTLLVSFQVDRMFHIPSQFLSTTRWLLLLVGTSVSIGFPAGIFGGILEGLQEFYVLNWTNVVSTLLRAALIVIALHRGYGLLTLGLITVLVPLLASFLRCMLALRLCPVPFGQSYVDRATFRQIANHGGITFMILIAGRLKFKTDEIVIGTFMSAAAITYFNIGARIVDYAGEVVTALSQIFVPMSSQSDARGDMYRLRKIFLLGNRVCGFTIFPICLILLILGKSVIEVWVGKKYVAASYPVLVIMILCTTLWWAQGASGRILMGMSKHGTWAVVTFVEGICNLILSIILVRPYGIVGDALGTAIPLTFSMLFFMPHHLCKKLGIRLLTYLRESYSLPFLLCLPLAAVLLLMRRWFIPHNYRQLGLQLFAGGAVYGSGLLWAFLTNKALRVGELSLKGTSAEAENVVVSPLAAIYPQDV
ncbi:MAG: polysaccharide biosynthesis C-terminal domain-containing protein [Candidatus Sulfotelmatobacter sp.]